MTTPLIFISFLLLALSDAAEISNKIGINYGRLGNNLASPYDSIRTIQSMKAGRVKIYDANPEILKLLAGTKIHVAIMVPNQDIISIASNQTVANQWVQDNVMDYYPDTMIRFILVGNEVFSYYSAQDRRIWQNIVPAMRKLKNSLRSHNVKNIKISTTVAMDVLQTTFPPSRGRFRSDISNTVITPLLKFLNGSKSFFCVDAYPYFPWSANATNVSLNYALFNSKSNYTDPGSRLNYTNLLDQMLDAHIFAMNKLGFNNISLLIAETGWPHAGDLDQPGANIHNAATYNRNLVKRMTATPPIGTPARPGVIIPTFIFSLYDENQKTGPTTERHWGLLHPNGTSIYEVDLLGQRPAAEYEPLPAAINNMPYKGRLWCVAVAGTDLRALEDALTYACGRGNGTCSPLTPGRECYEPVSIRAHANYAFSSYWAQFRNQSATCYFNGLAMQTTRNPSRGNCTFPSVTL